jgi:hypothetical protein
MKRRICFYPGTGADYGGTGRILLNLIRNLDLSRFEPLIWYPEQAASPRKWPVTGG